MSKLNPVESRSVHQQSVDEIRSVIAQNGNSFTNKDLAMNAVGLESLQTGDINLSNTQGVYKNIKQSLGEQPAFARMLAPFTKEQQEFALEAAALTIMAGGDPVAWHTAAKQPVGGGNVTVVNPNQGALDYASNYEAALEGFEPASLNQFIAQSAYVNAMAAIQGGFEEAFFPIQIVPAGTTGVDVTITIPKVLQSQSRTLTGQPVNFTKTNLLKAYVDGTVLENNVTKIVPVAPATPTDNSTYLAPHASVNYTTVVIDGQNVNTRALAFGTKIDLIAVATTAALQAAGVLNETDTLDPVINVGKLYFTAQINNVSLNVAFDVSGQPGSLLQRSAQGSDREYQTTFIAKLVLDKGSITSVNGGNVATFEAAMSTVEKAFGSVMVSAIANTEFGTMQVTTSDPKWESMYNVDGDSIAIPANSSVVMLGYTPAARRTNANLRNRGTIIDSTTTVVYRFPVPLSSPIISQNPVGGAVNTSIEGLAQAERLRNNNNAVKTVLALEEVLAAGSGLQIGMPTMGAEYVVPTYSFKAIDVQNIVTSLASKDTLVNIQGALTGAIMTVVNDMIQRSRYLAAIEFTTGNNQDYEVILVTDTVIYPWLMADGDSRTLGNNRKFKITQTLNEAMKGRIYIGLRRATRDGQMSALDFGSFLYTPALTHEVQVSRTGATVKEIHTIPRNAYYATLPILGRIDVTGLVELTTL